MNIKHETYLDSLKADEAFEQAIKAQFGEKATRWTAPHAEYNEQTKHAYKCKVQADWLRNEFAQEAVNMRCLGFGFVASVIALGVYWLILQPTLTLLLLNSR